MWVVEVLLKKDSEYHHGCLLDGVFCGCSLTGCDDATKVEATTGEGATTY